QSTCQSSDYDRIHKRMFHREGNPFPYIYQSITTKHFLRLVYFDLTLTRAYIQQESLFPGNWPEQMQTHHPTTFRFRLYRHIFSRHPYTGIVMLAQKSNSQVSPENRAWTSIAYLERPCQIFQTFQDYSYL